MPVFQLLTCAQFADKNMLEKEYNIGEYKYIILALLLSMLAHGAILSIPINLQEIDKQSFSTGRTSIKIVLIPKNNTSHKKTISEINRKTAAEVKRKATARAKAINNSDVPVKRISPQGSSKTINKKPLNLTLPENLSNPIRSSGGETENGALIMSGEILKFLNKNSSKSFYIAENPSKNSFRNNGGGHYIRFKNKCFRVTEADPLDSTSQELWWMVKCR